MTDLLLGLDLGTTSCKAAVVTPDGAEIAHGQAPIVWTPVTTGAEIAPVGFLECALAAARAALAELDDPRVVGLGVSSMAETGVLLGRDGEPVVPSIAWYDSESSRAAAAGGRVFCEGKRASTAGSSMTRCTDARKRAGSSSGNIRTSSVAFASDGITLDR